MDSSRAALVPNRTAVEDSSGVADNEQADLMMRDGGNGRNRLAGAAIRCQPDSRLVGLVREGHDLAFDEIVRRYRAPLVGFAGAIVPHDHAEDVVQESLTKAHGALGRGDAEINLRPWLYTIVRNRALNALRDEPDHDRLDENFDGVPQPPDVAARREEIAALVARLKRLPDPQREAIVKRELEGRSHEEIASSLGLSAVAVRGLIYRARAALRDGAGMLMPMPVLRMLLSSASSSDATAAAGAAASLAAGGGGGIALKAGATLGITVIAIGSGFAIQHRDGKPDGQPTVAQRGAGHSARGHDGGAMGTGDLRANSGPGSEDARGDDGTRGPGGPDGSGSSGSSGEGSSGDGSGSSSSGEGSGGTDDRSGSGGSGDNGGGSVSGTSGDDGGGSGGDGGSDTSGSGDGSSGDGGGGLVATDDGGGSGTSGDGDDNTTTTTTTTTTSDGGSDGPG